MIMFFSGCDAHQLPHLDRESATATASCWLDHCHAALLPKYYQSLIQSTITMS